VGVLCASGCLEGDPEQLLDVALSVDLPEVVRSSEPFEFAYRWDPGDRFESTGHDYLVFVHFVDAEGNIVAQDDHALPVPSSEWRSGRSVEYRRWFRFLDPIDVEHVDVVVGLYDDEGRASLRDFARHDYAVVGRLEIRVDAGRGIPLRARGWYKLERSPTSSELWHWLGEQATVVFANPRRDAVLHIEASAPVPLLGSPQRVMVYLNEVEIANFEISTEDRLRWRLPATAEELGEGEFVEFRIATALNVVSSEVIPGSVSDRRLGLKVFYLHLGEG
jgi:hypothetical protein